MSTRRAFLGSGIGVATAASFGAFAPLTEAAKARDLVLKKKYKEARAILEPKVVDGKASNEEVRLLKTICKEQGDRMCVALCDTKLK